MRFLPLFAFALVACSSSTTPPGDGGPRDTGTGSDSGSPDSGSLDAGSIDSGSGDSSLLPDASLSDGAPSIDGSATDAATVPDGSILPPVDAGDPFGDGGALGDPAWVDVDVRTSTMCPPLMPCAGDVVGTWDVTGVCVEVPLGTALSMCPGAMVTSATGMARGRVSFTATVAHRVAQSTVEVDVFVPSVCAGFVGGCPGIESRLMMRNPDSACVTTAAGDCDCATRQITNIDNTDTYTIVGNEIVSGVGMRHYAYCVSGTTLMYQDTTPGAGTREPGIISLGMR